MVSNRQSLLTEVKKNKDDKDINLMEKNVYVNCSGFLIIYSKDHPLDKTRIHPDNYNLTYKIC